MSAKKAPQPTSKTPPVAHSAPTKSSSRAATKAPAKTRAKSAAQRTAAQKSAAPKPIRTSTKAAAQPAPSSQPASDVPRKIGQRAGKRGAQTAANTPTDRVDEPLPLVEPTQTLLRPPVFAPVNEHELSQGAAISPQLRRGFVMVLLLVAGVLLLVALFQSRDAWWAALTAAAGSTASTPVTPVSTAATEAATGTLAASTGVSDTVDIAKRVGIISGHRGNDSGAVCPDGLTEAQVNFDAATRVASILRAQGYTVDVLDEFDARLKNYRARALLSIHSDSCADINELATGYKVARTYMSAIPEEEDKLVACVSEHYKAATGLKFHRNTVTHDMLQYHAFREVDVSTPSAIIELGFLNLDRDLLTHKKDTVAKGVSEGLLCYLRGETP